MNSETSWKDAVRKAASDASTMRLVPKMASDTGIPATNIHQFVSTGYLGSNKVKMLEEWLISNGILESPTASAPPSDVNETLARELDTLAAVIRSSAYPQEIKSDRFVAAIRGWNRAVDSYIAMLKEQK